jgi:hypothetical protein
MADAWGTGVWDTGAWDTGAWGAGAETGASAAEVVAALMAYEVETGVTFKEAIRYILAAVAGKVSGADSTTMTFDAGGNPGTTRITATVDASGNRTSVTLN